MRIQKHLSEQKILSRREAERYILEGKIKINGKVVTNLATQIDPLIDKVEIVKGKSGTAPEIKKITLAFNKARGISSSKVRSEGKNIFDILPPQFRNLNAIGRLDKESEGLIILSNDGVLTNVITGQDHSVEKEYVVEVKEKVTGTKINALQNGMILEDGPTLPTKAKALGVHSFSIILKEGRNHQIRRMAAKINLTVNKLRRVRIGTIRIGNIPVNGFRILSQTEVDKLKKI